MGGVGGRRGGGGIVWGWGDVSSPCGRLLVVTLVFL